VDFCNIERRMTRINLSAAFRLSLNFIPREKELFYIFSLHDSTCSKKMWKTVSYSDYLETLQDKWLIVRSGEGGWVTSKDRESWYRKDNIRQWVIVKDSELLWRTVSYCEGQWVTVNDSEAMRMTVRQREWQWGSVNDSEALWMTMRYFEWQWGTVNDSKSL
jgi:hypothetical protein